jgi:hypothetical protein
MPSGARSIIVITAFPIKRFIVVHSFTKIEELGTAVCSFGGTTILFVLLDGVVLPNLVCDNATTRAYTSANYGTHRATGDCANRRSAGR